jgi:hypothetical protein
MQDIDFTIAIDTPEIPIKELIKILEDIGYEVEDYWGGCVDGRRLNIKKRVIK